MANLSKGRDAKPQVLGAQHVLIRVRHDDGWVTLKILGIESQDALEGCLFFILRISRMTILETSRHGGTP
ncbi:hypothetical protein XYCOK13_39370 [Xylanibacillus composti]|uniref:Uncharacterized protein n=1 Tax=Xylanibacillus composti TaxID=1572762 RepID=A0A8J4H535_9BACL|nr:hypothetical protein XYCOK13_39370 [Xylanibacillus composti]